MGNLLMNMVMFNDRVVFIELQWSWWVILKMLLLNCFIVLMLLGVGVLQKSFMWVGLCLILVCNVFIIFCLVIFFCSWCKNWVCLGFFLLMLSILQVLGWVVFRNFNSFIRLMVCFLLQFLGLFRIQFVLLIKELIIMVFRFFLLVLVVFIEVNKDD